MLTTILFDLDGTLLPMDQEVFVKDYLNRLAAKMVPYGYDPQMLVKAVWRGTGAMVANDGRKSNEAVFWETFAGMCGQDALEASPSTTNSTKRNFRNAATAAAFSPPRRKPFAPSTPWGTAPCSPPIPFSRPRPPRAGSGGPV